MKSDRLSPGQSLTDKFPTVGEKLPSPAIANWTLLVHGRVETPLVMSLEQFQNLPAQRRVGDTICVTGWTRLDDCWEGVTLDELLVLANPLPEARFVRFVAYSNRDHDTSLPLDYASEHVLLATKLNDLPLTTERGGPVRSVCMGRYFYKSLKWLRSIELLAEDKLGYWEQNSYYHNNADPWKNERYISLPLAAEEFTRRILMRDFSGVMAIKDEQFYHLSGVDLSGANFEKAQIKGCSLNHAHLNGANFTDANFTLSTFVNASLRNAVFVRCDLEGANFQNADLRGADLRGAYLTATKFVKGQHSANIRGAHFLLKDIEGEGVGEKERAFLLDPAQGAFIN